MPKTSQKLSVGLVYDDTLDSSDGVAQYVKTLGGWLVSRGHNVAYLVGQTQAKQFGGAPVYSLARNLKIPFNGNRLSIPLPAGRRVINKLLRDKQFDVIHVMMPHSPFMAQRVIDCAPANTTVIGTFHVYPAGRLARFGGKLLSLWYGKKIQRLNHIVSVSPAAQAYAKTVFNINSSVVPNPVDINRYRVVPRPARLEEIVFLGRLVPRKGCIFLISALAKMKNKSVRLVIAGDGPQKKRLQAKVKKLGLQTRVEFKGYINEADKPKLLAQAKIACFPSLYGESFGIVLIEAMAAGANIVLGGNNPGYRSVLKHQPALLVNPTNTPAFAARLDELLKSTAQTKSLNAWQNQTVEQYDINVVGEQLLRIYRQ